jgi:hypothetical protein
LVTLRYPIYKTAQEGRKTLDDLDKKEDDLEQKLGPEYVKLMDGLDQVDDNNEAKEFGTALSALDKQCK